MKYASEIEIKRPLDYVVKLFDNPKHYDKWMKGLISFEVIEGKSGQNGTKSRFTFKMGKSEMVMIETVINNDLPKEHLVNYEAKNVYNEVRTSFESIEKANTKCIVEHKFEFDGFMKIIGSLFPGSFKKQSKKYLVDFKNFVESQGNDKYAN